MIRAYAAVMGEPTVITRSIEVAVPAAVLYEFHRDTRNVPLVSPPGTRFLRIDGEFPLEMGGEVHLEVVTPPVPFAQKWHIRIVELVPDRLVVDEAISSPFRTWRHEHRFDPLGPERALLTDHVVYTAKAGPLGELVNRLSMRTRMEESFDVRQRLIRERLEAA